MSYYSIYYYCFMHYGVGVLSWAGLEKYAAQGHSNLYCICCKRMTIIGISWWEKYFMYDLAIGMVL